MAEVTDHDGVDELLAIDLDDPEVAPLPLLTGRQLSHERRREPFPLAKD